MNRNLIFFDRNITPIRKLLMMHLAAGGKLTDYTVTGNPVSFETNVAKPLSVLAAFSPVQAGSGDPSPENVRPITGFTGANVYLSPTDSDDPAKQTFAVTFPALGKNLFDISTVESGTLDGYGNKVANASRTVTGFITLKAGTYTISRKAATDWWKIWSYTLDEEPLQAIMNNVSTSHTITLSADSKIRIAFDYIVDSGNEVQLESGSSATAYKPYTNTAYGGTLDLSTGVLTVEWVKAYLKEMQYYNYSGNRVFASGIGKDKTVSIYSDTFPVVNNNNIDESILVYNNGAGYAGTIYFIKDGMESVDDFKEWLNGLETNPSIVYKPQTPLVYQLTPTEILSLVGDNVLWSDLNGDMTVKYLKKG